MSIFNVLIASSLWPILVLVCLWAPLDSIVSRCSIVIWSLWSINICGRPLNSRGIWLNSQPVDIIIVFLSIGLIVSSSRISILILIQITSWSFLSCWLNLLATPWYTARFRILGSATPCNTCACWCRFLLTTPSNSTTLLSLMLLNWCSSRQWSFLIIPI